MAFRTGGGGGDRQPNRHFGLSHRSKRPRRDSVDFGSYYVSDRDSQPPEPKRSKPIPYDSGGLLFLAQPRLSPSLDTWKQPDCHEPTPPPLQRANDQYDPRWVAEPRFSSDPDLGSEALEPILVRRGDNSAEANPLSAEASTERTESGLTICSDVIERCASTQLLEDDEAADRVREHMLSFRRRNPDSKHERILRSIINPRSMAAEYQLDDDSLQSIFYAANEIFFHGRLSQRVTWDWSHESSEQYVHHVIGTTALRRASRRGFETLIVLSSPILRDQKYSRRLLISTFLHELIHSYLFICCGFRARHCGGHTLGFRTIAKLIDDWAGPGSQLYLSKMEADLDHFRLREQRTPSRPEHMSHTRHTVVYPCSGFDEHNRAIYDSGPGYHDKNDQWWGHPRAVRPLHPGPSDPGNDVGSQYVSRTDTISQMSVSHTSSAALRVPPRY